MEKGEFALLSVFNKTGIVEFARGLVEQGYPILSSGGTANVLRNAGIPVKDVAELPGGGKAMLDHRVVTLSTGVHGGLLATESPEHSAELAERGIPRIGLVCVDMYPLKAEIAKPEATFESVIEKTDIGGPTMLRSGAKGGRIVICNIADRAFVLGWLADGQPNAAAVKRRLAAKSEFTVASYVLDSARFLGRGAYDGMLGVNAFDCRYGENPRQKRAAFYVTEEGQNDPFSPDKFAVVEGTTPSYINVTDLHCIIETMSRMSAAVAENRLKPQKMMFPVKHGNCCGAAVGKDKIAVAMGAVRGDPDAISGSLLGANFTIDAAVAKVLLFHLMKGGEKRIFDGIIAPKFTKGAINLLARKKSGKCRIYVNPALATMGKLGSECIDASRRFRAVRGGFLIQDGDPFVLTVPREWREELSDTDVLDLLLGWAIGSTGNSNSMVLTKNGILLGSGMGERSRVFAGMVALLHAKTHHHSVKGAWAYSDSYFPFQDGIRLLVKAGVEKIFASSGSIRDKKIFAAVKRMRVGKCKKKRPRLYTLPDALVRGFAKH